MTSRRASPIPPALASLVVLLLAAPPARAGEADAIAIEADRVNQAACLDVAAQKDVNRAGVAMAEVSAVWVKVDEVYEAAPDPKPAFLKYWRGVLGQCLDQDELALADLEAFAAAEAGDTAFTGLVRDARKRIVRIERALSGAVERPRPPFFVLGVGGGYQRVEAPSIHGWNYGLVSLDASLRIRGPFAVMAFLRAGVSDLNSDSAGTLLVDSGGKAGRSILPLFGVGPLLRSPGPVFGFVGLLLQLGPDSWGLLGAPLLVGAAITGGVEFPFGDSPMGLRLAAEVGNLHASITARGVASLLLRFEK